MFLRTATSNYNLIFNQKAHNPHQKLNSAGFTQNICGKHPVKLGDNTGETCSVKCYF